MTFELWRKWIAFKARPIPNPRAVIESILNDWAEDREASSHRGKAEGIEAMRDAAIARTTPFYGRGFISVPELEVEAENLLTESKEGEG